MTKPKRDHRFFEQWARRNGMRPVTRVTDVKVDGKSVGNILVADSGEMISQFSYPNLEHELPFYYRTGYAIDRAQNGTWLAAFNDYPPDAFSEYAGAARQDARVADCVQHAVRMIHDTEKAGLYRGNDRRFH